MRAGLEDLADLIQGVLELAVGVEVVRSEPDARVRTKVAEDLPLCELLVHGLEVRHVDGDRAAAALRLPRRADVKAPRIGAVDQELRLA